MKVRLEHSNPNGPQWCQTAVMPSAILALLAGVAIAQGRPASPAVTPRSALPVTRGPITFVNPGSACPPHKGGPVRVGSSIIQPLLLDYTPPRAAPSAGRVLVEAAIRQDGTVGKTTVLRGPQVLHQFALDAVRQWKFATTCLNGLAIPIVVVLVVDLRTEAQESRHVTNTPGSTHQR
jgi:outer membrane biosynthesis protein TonB